MLDSWVLDVGFWIPSTHEGLSASEVLWRQTVLCTAQQPSEFWTTAQEDVQGAHERWSLDRWASDVGFWIPSRHDGLSASDVLRRQTVHSSEAHLVLQFQRPHERWVLDVGFWIPVYTWQSVSFWRASEAGCPQQWSTFGITVQRPHKRWSLYRWMLDVGFRTPVNTWQSVSFWRASAADCPQQWSTLGITVPAASRKVVAGQASGRRWIPDPSSVTHVDLSASKEVWRTLGVWSGVSAQSEVGRCLRPGSAVGRYVGTFSETANNKRVFIHMKLSTKDFCYCRGISEQLRTACLPSLMGHWQVAAGRISFCCSLSFLSLPKTAKNFPSSFTIHYFPSCQTIWPKSKLKKTHGHWISKSWFRLEPIKGSITV